jgi:putative oxidoreductase
MSNTNAAFSLGGRFLLAILFILSGLSKLGAAAGTQAYIAKAGLPLPVLAYVVAVVVELGGGLMLLVGYRTRVAALVLALFTLAAAAFFHNQLGDRNQFIHFMKNLAICGGLLQLYAFGAGGFSIDGRRQAAAAG